MDAARECYCVGDGVRACGFVFFSLFACFLFLSLYFCISLPLNSSPTPALQEKVSKNSSLTPGGETSTSYTLLEFVASTLPCRPALSPSDAVSLYVLCRPTADWCGPRPYLSMKRKKKTY